jgi:hypothetical protein
VTALVTDLDMPTQGGGAAALEIAQHPSLLGRVMWPVFALSAIVSSNRQKPN